MENVAVLPVPDCAWAMTSRPWMIGRIARCWIAEGFSKSGKACFKDNPIERKSEPTVGVYAAQEVLF